MRAGAEFEGRRHEMVEDLIRSGIDDPGVIEAMRNVPRHEFVPPLLLTHAYEDRALPIEEGQTISQPFIVALMAQALLLSPSDSVLEIGTGSGYAAAVLGEIVRKVYSVERLPNLADSARRRLTALGYSNVHVTWADGTLGFPDHAPYDAITVTAGAPRIPESLREQLAPGGRLVIPVGADPALQALLRITRRADNQFSEEKLDDVRFVPLIGAEGWQQSDDDSPVVTHGRWLK